jgi:hypothetical protein
LTNPADTGYYGTANLKTISGVFLNTTSQTQLVDVGFPTTVVANVNSVVVKDITDQYTLKQGVNYNAYTDGVEFTLNDYTTKQFYIQFNSQTNTTNTLIRTLNLNSVTQTIQNGQILYYGETTYTNTGSTGTFNFYINTQYATKLNNVTVIIDNTVIPASDITTTGTQIIVTGVNVGSGNTITIQVYYTAGAVSHPVSFLFVELVSAFGGIITPWFLGLAIMIMLYLPVYNVYSVKRKKNEKVDKDKTVFIGELSAITLVISIWIIIGMMYYAGVLA